MGFFSINNSRTDIAKGNRLLSGYFVWVLFRVIYILAFVSFFYVLLRVLTYGVNSGFFMGFFEMFFSFFRFFWFIFKRVLLNFIEVTHNPVAVPKVVQDRDAVDAGIRNTLPFFDLLESKYEPYARIFDEEPYDFESNYWIDPSVFDLWSYNLVKVPSGHHLNEDCEIEPD